MDCRDMIQSEAYADFILQRGYGDRQTIAGCTQEISSRYEALYTPLSPNGSISVQQYGYRSIPKLFAVMDKESMEQTGVTAIQQQSILNLTGKGVLIGFVDTGIDYKNEVFLREDGSTRVAAIWDQSKQTGNPPAHFAYGREYSEAMLQEMVRNPVSEEDDTLDESGHGTFLAGIAAGKENTREGFAGAAPDAEIIMVKLKPAKRYLRQFFEISEEAEAYQENDIMMGIRYLLITAYQMRKPLVICLGLGCSLGGRDGFSPLDFMLDDAAWTLQTIVTVAVGNEAAMRHHFAGLIANKDGFEDVELRVEEENQGFSMELWAHAPEMYSVAVTSPSGETIARIPPRQSSSTFRFLFENTTLTVDYQTVLPVSGQFMILFRFRTPAPGIWKIRVYNDFYINGIYNMWLPNSRFLSAETYFLRSNPDITLTVPAAAAYVITLGAYDYRTETIYLHSGRGYSADNEVKPDLTAPGVEVLGPTPQGRFIRRTGTSIAAANTAGAAALLFEWAVTRGNQPTMNTNEALIAMIRGATRKTFREYPDKEWGYGMLNLYQTFLELRNL